MSERIIATDENIIGAVQAARAWEAYQASLSASESYDYTSALFAFDPSNN